MAANCAFCEKPLGGSYTYHWDRPCHIECDPDWVKAVETRERHRAAGFAEGVKSCAAEITALRAELADARLQIAGGDMLIHAANLERDALAARLAVPGDRVLDAIHGHLKSGKVSVNVGGGWVQAADALTALRARVAGLEGAAGAALAYACGQNPYHTSGGIQNRVLRRTLSAALSPSAAQEARDAED